MPVYVYSTSSCSCDFVEYKKPDDNSKNPGHSQVVKRVTIKGGHNIPKRHLMTPNGVVTEVSDEDFAFLEQNEEFKRQIKLGFITFDKKKVDPAEKAKNMTQKDGSALLTPADLNKEVSEDAEIKTFKSKGKK